MAYQQGESIDIPTSWWTRGWKNAVPSPSQKRARESWNTRGSSSGRKGGPIRYEQKLIVRIINEKNSRPLIETTTTRLDSAIRYPARRYRLEFNSPRFVRPGVGGGISWSWRNGEQWRWGVKTTHENDGAAERLVQLARDRRVKKVNLLSSAVRRQTRKSHSTLHLPTPPPQSVLHLGLLTLTNSLRNHQGFENITGPSLSSRENIFLAVNGSIRANLRFRRMI